ncbi:MAG: RT0821/Lpp0805 family surface protein [Pseudomonadota bacterium]
MSFLVSNDKRDVGTIPNTQHIDQDMRPVNTIARVSIVSIVLMGLTACSVSSGVSSLESEEKLVTQSVTKPVETDGVSTVDAEIIKTAVADAETTKLLAWQNPESGSKGTITAIDKFIGSHGQQCKKFQTTVDTFMGISLYNGETCELKKGFWVLSWFLKAENG